MCIEPAGNTTEIRNKAETLNHGQVEYTAWGGSRCSSLLYLIPRVAIQALLQALLVESVPNQTNGPRQDKQAVQVADLHNVLDLSLHVQQVWS